MKKVLIFVALLLLGIDLVLGYFIYHPSSTAADPSGKISVTSTIVGVKPKIVNLSYLNSKLEDRRFWSNSRVNLYKSSVQKATVKKLRFVLTDKPQPILIQAEKQQNKLRAIMSYSQEYNANTKEMTITIQEDRLINKAYSRERIFSGLILYSIFDLTYNRPRNMQIFQSELKTFLTDFYMSPGDKEIVKFELI